MEPVSPRKLIITVMIITAAVSAVVSVSTISLVTGSRPDQVIERIVERAPTIVPGAPQSANPSAEPVVAVVRSAAPAVVSIVATKDVPVVEQYFVDPFGSDPFFQQFFGGGGIQVPQYRQRGTQKQEVSSGSGFIVSADGLILTNKHVVADTSAEYTVFLNDGTKLSAKVLARDPVQDLAVVKVERKNLPTVSLGDSSIVQIGQSVVAIGNALGEFRNTVSAGVVSGLHRSIVASGGGAGQEQLQELIQTDAAINPGNSGGPLLNIRGEVIAINVAMAQGAENIGFAIPINEAKRDLESVKAVGRIVYPFLGIRYVQVTEGLKAERKLPVDYGALITGDDRGSAIVAGGPADKAGLHEGDIILEMNGTRVDVKMPLTTLLRRSKVGDTIKLKILRGNETLNPSVTLEERK